MKSVIIIIIIINEANSQTPDTVSITLRRNVTLNLVYA